MNSLSSFFTLLILGSCFHGSTADAIDRPARLSPTHKDIAYDEDHAAQKLDVYLAKTDQPTPAMIYFHGGGWRAGSKDRVPNWLLKAVRDGWLAVISVEYRFTDVAPHPAQVDDCLRAIQYVRLKAAQWNIDPQRIGATGGSAGGHLSLWVAMHDDVAQADSTDAVVRESSRVACAVSFAGPTDWSLLEKLEHKHPAYRQLLGYEPSTPAQAMKAEAKIDASPISFVSKDDPPVMLVHGDKDQIVPVVHARNMNERLKSAGVKSELIIVAGGKHSVSGADPQTSTQATTFIREQLRP